MNHNKFMLKAIEVARNGEGLTCPNPPVGAVLVENDIVVAEGWHEKSKLMHAEVVCIKNYSGKDISKCTLYITLEPCSTHGDTPPCSDLILKSGIKKVVIAVVDPNPSHNGKAVKMLEDAGVDVILDVCKSEALDLIDPFRKRILTGLPYITLKMAITLDGKIADMNGNSKWISSEESRDYVHSLRRKVDAIMVGSNTINIDNPSLLPRPMQNRFPWRIIIGKNINKAATVLTDEFSEKTLIKSGNLKTILQDLSYEKKIMHILCEGGGILATNLIKEKLVDKLILFITPKLLGLDGISWFNIDNINIDDVFNMKNVSYEQIGNDIMMTSKLEN